MRLSEFKKRVATVKTLSFKTASGEKIAAHFHVSELAWVTKDGIDCGGHIHTEKTIQLQLWVADDTDHRLIAAKLLRIIDLAEEKLPLADTEIEVVYQQKTLGLYSLQFDGEFFILHPKHTDCLARERCLTPAQNNTCCA